MFHEQNVGQNHDIEMANKFKKMWQCLNVWNDKNQNCIQIKIKSILNTGNA
jgi:hypothetical protein